MSVSKWNKKRNDGGKVHETKLERTIDSKHKHQAIKRKNL